jgi:hypothetical protein
MTGDLSEFNRSAATVPAIGAFAITPGQPLTRTTRSIYVGGGGMITATLVDGSVLSNGMNFRCGQLYPLQLKSVDVSTTATNLIGLY